MSTVASSRGRVVLVGAGPGDPELITVKGLRCLHAAQVVVYDRLIHPRLLDEVPATAERIFAGKVPHGASCEQGWIQEILIDRAQKGRVVVRLKGGDPFVFGRGGEELEACRAAGIPCEVVPGVSSAIGVATAAGIPLTHRGLARSFGVFTAHRPEDLAKADWQALARLDTLVVMMGVEALPQVTRRLIEAGLPAGRPAAIVERGTWAEERALLSPVEDLPFRALEAAIRPPAIALIGEVVRLYRPHEPGSLASLLENLEIEVPELVAG